jgi:PIN domain nuclease of toxin-antitoxin system
MTRTSEPQPLLLDTHVWLWLVGGSPELSTKARHTLTEAFYRDPADRLIVATARVANALLMTRDRRILDYAARGHLTTIAA